MSRNIAAFCIVFLSLAGNPSSLAGQSPSPELDTVSKAVENYFQKKGTEWKLKTVPAASPPGTQPGPYIVIQFWSSEKCLTAEVIIDGVNAGKHPVSCQLKLAIDQSTSDLAADTRLREFVRGEPSASPVSAGDKGYLWRGIDVVFLKGKFTFWLSGSVGLRVGDFTINREFMEKLAKEIADAVPGG